MWSVVNDGIAWSVGLSVMIVNPAKTAELIEMLCGMWTRVGPSNHVAQPGEVKWSVCSGNATLCHITVATGHIADVASWSVRNAFLSPVYTIQPVVKPVWEPVVSCIHTSNQLSNPFDIFDHQLTSGSILYTAGCQTGCTTQFDNRLNEQQLFVHHGWRNSGCSFNRLSTGLYNRLYRVNGVLD